MTSNLHHDLVDLLAPWGEIRLRRMFGGLGAYRDDVFFAIIDDGIAYFKVDDESRGDYEAAHSEPFSFPRRDRDGQTRQMTITSYWRVPDEVIEEDKLLSEWADKAYHAAIRSSLRNKTKQRSAQKAKLNGIGMTSMKRLKECGIGSRKDLENLGAVESFLLTKKRFPQQVSLNLLWSLYAALHDLDIATVTPDIKDHLLGLLASHTGSAVE